MFLQESEAFDAHFHIIDKRFPLVPNDGYLPQEFTCRAYLGRMKPHRLSGDSLPTLLRLAERGVRVKATGFGRVDFDVPAALRQICSANPDALMFGTDLPSTRAPRPYTDDDFALLVDALGSEMAAKAVCRNAVEFYRPGRSRRRT